MRWLFLFLVVLNAGYLAWELNREQQPRAMQPALPDGVERIVLLQELEREKPAKAVAQVADKVAQPQPAGVSGAAAKPAEPAGSDKAVSPPVAVASLDSSAGGAGEKEKEQPRLPESAPTGDLCFTLGPFSEMKTLRLVTREIKDYVVEASFRSREEQEQSMFRVYLKPVGSKQEARELIKELVSKNIRDYFIITDGPNKNGISLGYFSNKGRAYRHAERVRKLGFDAIAEPVFRTYTIYWLDYRIKAGNEIPQQIFDEHLENSAQKLSRSCN